MKSAFPSKIGKIRGTILLAALCALAWSDPDYSNPNPPGQNYHFALQALNESDPPRFMRRVARDTIDVPEKKESLYQTALLGEVRMTFSELPPGAYTVTLGNAEYRTHSQHNRVTDIYLNGECVLDDYCHFDRFGFRTGGTLRFRVEAPEGQIELELRRDRPENAWPRFAWVRLEHEGSDFSILKSAQDFAPPGHRIKELTNLLPSEIVQAAEPPFAPSYKLTPEPLEALTPADIVGPDGIVYPNWLQTGIDGGIPTIPVKAYARDFGAIANDPLDDSAGIQAAIDWVGQNGGGAVLLDAGSYRLETPLFIFTNGVVLRGDGAARTRLSFEFAPTPKGIRFFTTRTDQGGVIAPDSLLMVWADFHDLRSLAWWVDDTPMGSRKHLAREPYLHSLTKLGQRLLESVGPGDHRIRIEASYGDGTVTTETFPVTVVDGPTAEYARGLTHLGAINLVGSGNQGKAFLLAKDGKRGGLQLSLANAAHGLEIGDRLDLVAPVSERWNQLVRNAGPPGAYRHTMLAVSDVTGNRLKVSQPLRIDFPTSDGAYLQKVGCIERSGVEDLTVVQPQKLWTCGIQLFRAWECWIEGVRVEKAGRHPAYVASSKKCEVRDCVFDDVWFKQGGGSGYVGFERSYDCLMESVSTYHMRHAPNLQWSANGNVIRRCDFHDSDGQWHAGWSHENLYEDLSITSGWDNGNYGYGLYSSSPEATSHGPTGPRNVVYNCDIAAPYNGIWMGGMNENFIIAYNRIINGFGPAVYAKHASFDHIITGNTFVPLHPEPAAFYFASADCVGIEITNNRIVGPVHHLVGGEAEIQRLEGNVVETQGDIMRPKPEVPSIFLWQRANGRAQLAERGQAY